MEKKIEKSNRITCKSKRVVNVISKCCKAAIGETNILEQCSLFFRISIHEQINL